MPNVVHDWRSGVDRRCLEPRAGSLVGRCWLWTLAAIVVLVPLGLYGAVFASYFPYHRAAPPIKALVITTEIALLSAISVALLASAFFAFRRTRWLAGLMALAPLPIVGLLAIGYLLFGLWPGPSSFVRYVGAARYEVPWRYEPVGSAEPGPIAGFGLHIYSPGYQPFFQGRAEGFNTRLSLRPAPQDGLAEDFERWKLWLGPSDETNALGLNRLVSRDPSKGEPRLAESTVYYSRDASGSIVRLIQCNWANRCDHYLQVGDLRYRMEYPVQEIEHWRSFEERTIALFASFAVHATPSDQPRTP